MSPDDWIKVIDSAIWQIVGAVIVLVIFLGAMGFFDGRD